MNRVCFLVFSLLLASCSSVEGDVPTSTTLRVAATTTSPEPVVTTVALAAVPTSSTTSVPEATLERAWSVIDAERHIKNYLAALAAGAYEQAAWSAENNGITLAGQAPDETVADALSRFCSDGACAGPYAVEADGPGLIDPDSGQAASTVTVSHLGSGQAETMELGTHEGQLVVVGLPPLVPAKLQPTLVEMLFGEGMPNRVVVARFDAFEIWENGQSEWVTNWWAGETIQVEGDVIAGQQFVAGLRQPESKADIGCWPRLMTRAAEVLLLEQCDTSSWRMSVALTGDERPTPVPLGQHTDGEYVWFAERGGAVVRGMGDAEGNLTSLETSRGLDLVGDDYAGWVRLSTDGARIAYANHADPAAMSHVWSPAVVVKDVASGSEVGRWTVESPILSLEFSGPWLLVAEVDWDVMDGGLFEQGHLVLINVETGAMNRVATPTRVFLPSGD